MAPMAGRQTTGRNKSRGEERSLEKYVGKRGEMGERMILIEIGEIRKDVKKEMVRVKEEMEKINEQMQEESKVREKERRKEKEEWKKEKGILERRITELEWINERKERAERRNNNVIKGRNWGVERLEQEIEGFVKEALVKEIEVVVKKASRIKLRGNESAVIVEIERWEGKREIMHKKKELKRGIYI